MIYKLALVLFFAGVIYAEDVVVFLKASNVTGFDTPMIPKYLTSLSGTVAVYKVQGVNVYMDMDVKKEYDPIKYNPTVWNWIVLGKGFKTCRDRDGYVEQLKGFGFVERIKSVILSSNQEGISLNTRIEKALIDNTFLRRPLKQHPHGGSTCAEMEFDEGKVLSITLSKTRDEAVAGLYRDLMVEKVFPALGARFAYAAKVEEVNHMDDFAIVDFGGKESWCELTFSKFLKNSANLLEHSFDLVVNIAVVQV